MDFNSFKPGVPKNWLLVMAGLIWSIIGMILCYLAFTWLKFLSFLPAAGLALIGISLSLVAYRFIFSRIARKNIERIGLSLDIACLFSFQTWQSYLVVIIMIALGTLLRSSSIPKYYLAVVYTTIGCSLFMASGLYYIRLWFFIKTRSN